MSKIEILLLLILLYFTIKGFFRGLVKQIFGFLTMIGLVIIFLYIIYYHDLHSDSEFYDSNKTALWSAVVLVAFIFGMIFLKHSLKKFLDKLSLGPLNHFGGGLIGFIKGGVLVLFFVGFIDFIQEEIDFVHEQDLKDMVIYQYINDKRKLITDEILDIDKDVMEEFKMDLNLGDSNR